METTFLISNLLPAQGITLLCGSCGVGKTTIAMNAGISVLLGKEFLGETPVTQGKVTFVMPDECDYVLRDKISSVDSTDYTVIWHFNKRKFVEILETSINRFKPSLVVIDSLQNILDGDVSSPLTTKIVEDLAAMSYKYNFAILLTCMLQKNEFFGPTMGGILGANHTVALSSVVWLVEYENFGYEFRTLRMRGDSEEIIKNRDIVFTDGEVQLADAYDLVYNQGEDY